MERKPCLQPNESATVLAEVQELPRHRDDGRKVSGALAFPLAHITPLRLPLANLRLGRNLVEFRFDVKNAMEGLLSNVFLEGAFGVWLRKGRPVVKPDGPDPSGMPSNRIA